MIPKEIPDISRKEKGMSEIDVAQFVLIAVLLILHILHLIRE